ncbi:MAG: two pore domain potassium channel family protein [Acidimicrobiales bacterium]|nr:two pore domain potassium channel family protein [Acidimicrobiales bacterium]
MADDTTAPRSRSQLARGSATTFLSLVVPVAVYFVLPLDRDTWRVGVLLGLVAVVAVLPVTIRHLATIDRSPHPLGAAVRALALLLGLAVAGFATVNYALAANTDQIPDLRTKVDGLYFTIVTMTSVGYGDIVPAGQTARALVSLQIILTITLIGGAIRMIGNLASRRHADD